MELVHAPEEPRHLGGLAACEGVLGLVPEYERKVGEPVEPRRDRERGVAPERVRDEVSELRPGLERLALLVAPEQALKQSSNRGLARGLVDFIDTHVHGTL